MAGAHIEAVAINFDPTALDISHVEVFDKVALVPFGFDHPAIEVDRRTPVSPRNLSRIHGAAIQVEGARAVVPTYDELIAHIEYTGPT